MRVRESVPHDTLNGRGVSRDSLMRMPKAHAPIVPSGRSRDQRSVSSASCPARTSDVFAVLLFVIIFDDCAWLDI